MIFLEMHQLRRDQNFEIENRFNLILVKFCSHDGVDAYIRRLDIKSFGFFVSNGMDSSSSTGIDVPD
jgi:hypothetical protein